MPPDNQKRKRPVASCRPCYTKKQKCDKQYPCTNCTRRRLPELCTYSFSEPEPRTTKVTIQSHGRSSTASEAHTPAPESLQTTYPPVSAEDGQNEDTVSQVADADVAGHVSAMVSHLGYSEGSKYNLFSLMKKFDLLGTEAHSVDATERALRSAESQIRKCLEILPKRPIINCLIQHFFEEVNWISELIHPPMFLNRYEQWWKTFPGASVDSLEFGVLILRICALSAQFIPSRSYGEGRVLGIPVNTVRLHCRNLSQRLQKLTDHIKGAKTLASVQHLFYWCCYLENEGAITDAWYALGDAIRVSQDVGLHLPGCTLLEGSINDVEKDLRRRCFWTLFTWDKYFSLILDRKPWIQYDVSDISFPVMRIISGVPKASPEQPDAFTERLLEARLAKLWSSSFPNGPPNDGIYDVCAAEEFYEKICKIYIPDLPPVFSLRDPDTKWDSDLRMLPRQRQMLRISIYASTCQLFLPLLQLEEGQIANLPQYKKDILLSQRHRLVEGAMRLLDGVFTLHDLLGRRPTALFLLSYFSFHAAVVLSMHLIWTVSTRGHHLGGQHDLYGIASALDSPGSSPRRRGIGWRHREYVDKALRLLYDLEGVSIIAKLAVPQLEKVIAKLESMVPPEQEVAQQISADGNGIASVQASSNWLGFELTSGEDSAQGTERFSEQRYHQANLPTPASKARSPTQESNNPLSTYSDASLDSTLGGSVMSHMDDMFSFPIDFEGPFDHWAGLQEAGLGLPIPHMHTDVDDSRYQATSQPYVQDGTQVPG